MTDRLALMPLSPAQIGTSPVEWRVAASPVGYLKAIDLDRKSVV